MLWDANYNKVPDIMEPLTCITDAKDLLLQVRLIWWGFGIPERMMSTQRLQL